VTATRQQLDPLLDDEATGYGTPAVGAWPPRVREAATRWCPQCAQEKPAVLFEGPFCEGCSDDYVSSPWDDLP
jgi:hypothetical protein